jgi:DNA-binding SARP family transcriptional activator
MPTLALHFFGAPYVEVNGALVDLERHKSMALLAYLAGTCANQERDTLAVLLWPELDQSRARAALRRTLTALVQVIGKEWLRVADGCVALPAQSNLWVDIWRFRELLVAAAPHNHESSNLYDKRQAALIEAANLYRDDFLAGFSVRDTAEFDNWQSYQAETLRRELAGALETLAYGYAERNQYDRAIEYARRRLALDPLHECAQRLLVGLYAWAGDRGAAMRQLEACVRLLAEEVGADPQPETIELATIVRAGQLPAWTGDFGNECLSHPSGARGDRG